MSRNQTNKDVPIFGTTIYPMAYMSKNQTIIYVPKIRPIVYWSAYMSKNQTIINVPNVVLCKIGTLLRICMVRLFWRPENPVLPGFFRNQVPKSSDRYTAVTARGLVFCFSLFWTAVICPFCKTRF